ncbi:CYFA0S06e04764g1_1 [Cyberlindnera fabianii]|uniref:DNA replication complex GINS protein PSF2 n=1 Tax=Cyberlindnera fabianii TaxID=36022 RepID=A0A061AUI5_CYBFA|nr:CYFA0S06e04764g1_1 [Cyberlindnera fabianii]
MALPNHLKNTFTPAEIEFLTENETITILPRYTMNGLDLITDRIPKIRAMQRVEVPIWFALILKSQRKCSIVPPVWLSQKELMELYDFEIAEPESFSQLPKNWLEIAKLFFENAPDDLTDEAHKLKSLVQDLKEIRLIKIKKGLKLLNESHLQLDNLSLMEINEIRPFVVLAMSKLTKLNEAAVAEEGQGDGAEEYEYDDDE